MDGLANMYVTIGGYSVVMTIGIILEASKTHIYTLQINYTYMYL